jgi:nitroreductase
MDICGPPDRLTLRGNGSTFPFKIILVSHWELRNAPPPRFWWVGNKCLVSRIPFSAVKIPSRPMSLFHVEIMELSTMETLSAIEKRRSIKQFDPNHTLTDAEVDRLIQLAMLSPTAFNIQHWRFVVVRDSALRQSLRKVSWNQPQVTDASLYVILCADLRAWAKEPERYWHNIDAETRAMILSAIERYYVGNPTVQRDEAMRSGSLAAQSLMLAAVDMGLGACPMTGFDFDAVGRLIQLPEDHVVVMAVAIGKPIQLPRPRGGQLPLEVVRIVDRF